MAKIHTLISRTTLRYGGKKSPGKDYHEPQELYHFSADELAGYLQLMLDDGWHLTLTVLAQKDERRQVAKDRFPTPADSCPGCME